MIVDHGTYGLEPGRLREFLALHEKEGLPIQLEHPVAWSASSPPKSAT